MNEEDQLILDTPVEGWDETSLTVWLARQVRQTYINPSEFVRWLRDALSHLINVRGLSISALWRAKYPLAQKLEGKIKSLRQARVGGIKTVRPDEPYTRRYGVRDLKNWLLQYVFSGKCAYCESEITSAFLGREIITDRKAACVIWNQKSPKSSLTRMVTRIPVIWLAYDWLNLLPACQKCNNCKSDKFPVAHNANYVFDPSPSTTDLAGREDPLLLHPYFDEPSRHLRFGEAGIVVAVDGDQRGENTIEVFELNRDELTDQRRQRLRDARIVLNMLTVESLGRGDGRIRLTAMFFDRNARYSQACKDVIEPRLSELENIARFIGA